MSQSVTGDRAVRSSPEPLLRIKVSGAFEVWSFAGEDVRPRGRKAQAILAYLALSRGEWVPRTRLRRLLWSTRWDDQARNSLRQSIRELRERISARFPTVLEIERDRLRLHTDLIWLDGISGRPGPEAVPASPAGATPLSRGRLLETLAGLDEEYDRWLSAIGAVAAPAGGPPGRAGALPEPASGLPPVPARLVGRSGSRRLDDRRAGGYRIVVQVSPFTFFGSDPNGQLLAAGLTQEFAAAMARFRWLLVTQRTDVAGATATYGLQGHVRRHAKGWHLSVGLVDRSEDDFIAWSLSRDVEPDELDTLLGDYVDRTVAFIDPEIIAIEHRKQPLRASRARNALELTLLAVPLVYKFDQADCAQARDLLGRAIELDPRFGRARSFHVLCRVTEIAHGWAPNGPGEIARLREEVELAVACDPYDSLALTLSGHIHVFMGRDFEQAQQRHEQALRANPSCGFTWVYSALTSAYMSRTSEARHRLGRAREVLSHGTFAASLDGAEAVVSYFALDWQAAAAASRGVLRRWPGFSNMRKLLVGALCHLGRFDEAAKQHRLLVDMDPSFSWTHHLASYPFYRPGDRDRLAGALASAGLLEAAPVLELTRRPVDRRNAATMRLHSR